MDAVITPLGVLLCNGLGTSVPHSVQLSASASQASFATRSDKIVCVLVGLPARGKSYIARRLAQYVSFFYSTPCKVAHAWGKGGFCGAHARGRGAVFCGAHARGKGHLLRCHFRMCLGGWGGA